MPLTPAFSASSRVWESCDWVHALEPMGYRGWEIVSDGRYSLLNEDTFRGIRDTIGSTSLQVTVHAPYSDLNIASMNHPIYRESIRQTIKTIEAANRLGASTVTFHPGYLSPVGKLVPDKVWAAQKSALAEIGRAASEFGVLACLENLGGYREFLCRFPEEILGMTEDLEGIGITLDVGHANTVGRVPAFLAHLGSVHHLHIHDNHGSRDEHLALGAGTIDWKEVGRAVASRYSGTVVVEGRSLEEANQSLSMFRRWFV
ncbi:MAG: sugar phosphate isomerase/epimerase family protein [Methanomicrobiales archaeon]|nr:sugar phosphate isomerase/epimerase family protein [Methanomicrobiales archaeon]MDI6876522.1 sugar phosphate isomerase/epimerase family protein [Methanomicrobiales archaeon]